MAQTLPNGVIVPNLDGGEVISATGVQEMRTLGASVDTALGGRATNVYVDAAVNGARFYRGRIPNGSDVFTLADGAWTVSSAGFAGTMTNLPEAWPGTFIIMGTTEPIVKAAEFRPYGRDYRWETVTQGADGGGWMTWRKIISGGSSSAPAGLSPYAENAIRQAQMVHHYGRVDTAGLGAVSWRIDHGLANFKAKLLPIFRAAGIVPMITLNSRSWDNPENAGVTQSEVNQWVSNGWVEISNHGATHSNVTGDEAIEAYVSEGLAELETRLPAAAGKIFGFHVPGVGVTGAFDGFQGGATPENWNTVMGRAILRHHAFGSGHIPGTELRVLDGTIRQGLLHNATDTRPVSEITGKIDDAITTRRGFQIMSHPSNLDTAGYHSTADIQAIVDYIVAKRDAGELVTLSPYQMMVADATNPAPAWSEVTGKPATYTPTAHTHPVADVSGIVVDNSVGVRVTIGGHLVHASTGRRNVTSLFSTGLDPENTGAIYISRQDGRAIIEFVGVKLAAGAGTITWPGVLPSGFSSIRAGAYATVTRGNSFTALQVLGVNGSAMYWLSELSPGSSVSSTTTRPSAAITGQIEYSASGWPTTLPGTPA